MIRGLASSIAKDRRERRQARKLRFNGGIPVTGCPALAFIYAVRGR